MPEYYTESTKAQQLLSLVTIDMARKVAGETGFLSNTMSPGPRPTSAPSAILIHPAVWPEYTNMTDRTDRIDRRMVP